MTLLLAPLSSLRQRLMTRICRACCSRSPLRSIVLFNLLDLITSKTQDSLGAGMHVETLASMTIQAILQNASIAVTPDDRATFSTIAANALAVSQALGNITVPGVSLNATPQLTLEDAVISMQKWVPSCTSPDGLDVFSRNHTGFSSNWILNKAETLTIGDTGCPNTTEPAFCQFISSDPNVNVTVTPTTHCTGGSTAGNALFFITSDPEPLSFDPQVRVGQSNITCAGPELFVVRN